jgi:hypothetical protein
VGLLDRFRTARKTPPELDAISLRELRGRGADLSRPRHVLHFLYFAEEANARSAAEALGAGGYATSVGPPEGDVGDWIVKAESMRVVDETTVPGYRQWFEQVANEHGGEYDGWEAATKP